MPWYVILFIIYIIFDRLATIGFIGRRLEITPGVAVASVITGVLMIWVVVAALGAS